MHRQTLLALATAAILATPLFSFARQAVRAETGRTPASRRGPASRPRAARRTQAGENARARNVILFLGDGMGDSEITIARNYYAGAAGRLAMDSLPFTGAYATYSVQEADPRLPDYVTDSAASATAWATGVKTSNGRISTAPLTGKNLKTILERAQAAGLRTGDISTAELTDATPAALGAHVASRTCQGPQDMAACPAEKKSVGGLGSIAEQLIDHKIDVLLGGGKARFDQAADGGEFAGHTVLESAVSRGYRFVGDAAQLDAVHSGGPVIGLFHSGNMTQEWVGQIAEPFPGSGPQRCKEGNRPPGEPSVAQMTRKALELLSTPGRKQRAGAQRNKGFFLQVEGASIDKRDHAGDPCGQVGETVAFDEAIRVGLHFAMAHPGTMIIVTADHAHASQIIPRVGANQTSFPGFFSQLITKDGVPMTVFYATVPAEHTGTQVRIAAQGPGAARVVGVTDQTQLFHTIARALSLE